MRLRCLYVLLNKFKKKHIQNKTFLEQTFIYFIFRANSTYDKKGHQLRHQHRNLENFETP